MVEGQGQGESVLERHDLHLWVGRGEKREKEREEEGGGERKVGDW
jgi:hypothetical protein